MPILGLRDTANFVANQRPENWRETLMLLYPNSAEAAKAPLTALTSLMKSETTDDPIFHWWEKSLDDRRLRFGADFTNVATTLTIDSTYKSAKIAKAGDLIMIEHTGEIMRISSDPPDANTITVTRGVGGTTPTLLNYDGASVNPFAVIIGSAFEEASMAPSGINYDPTERSNYTQIFRSTMEMSRTAKKTRLRTGDQVKEARRECLEYIGIDMERGFWFGKASVTTLNGHPLRTTNGIIAQIEARAPTNVIANVGTLDMDFVETNMEIAFRRGSSQKMAFGSNFVLNQFQRAIRKNTTWNLEPASKEFGMSVNKLTSAYGEIVFKAHPLFNQMIGGTNPIGGGAFTSIANNLYILDMENFRYRYIDDLQFQGDLTAVGQDAMKSGYLAECGIEVHHAETHHIWEGITGAAADTP